MGIFDNLFGQEKCKMEKIKEDRDKIRKIVDENLKKIGFTNLEIKEVLDIITITETEIQALRDSLIITNVNQDNQQLIMDKLTNEIKELQVQMATDIKNKVKSIQKRKAEFRKEL